MDYIVKKYNEQVFKLKKLEHLLKHGPENPMSAWSRENVKKTFLSERDGNEEIVKDSKPIFDVSDWDPKDAKEFIKNDIVFNDIKDWNPEGVKDNIKDLNPEGAKDKDLILNDISDWEPKYTKEIKEIIKKINANEVEAEEKSWTDYSAEELIEIEKKYKKINKENIISNIMSKDNWIHLSPEELIEASKRLKEDTYKIFIKDTFKEYVKETKNLISSINSDSEIPEDEKSKALKVLKYKIREMSKIFDNVVNVEKDRGNEDVGQGDVGR